MKEWVGLNTQNRFSMAKRRAMIILMFKFLLVKLLFINAMILFYVGSLLYNTYHKNAAL